MFSNSVRKKNQILLKLNLGNKTPFEKQLNEFFSLPRRQDAKKETQKKENNEPHENFIY